MSSAFVLSTELSEALDNVENNGTVKSTQDDKRDIDVVPKNEPEYLEEEYYDDAHEKHDWVYLDKDAPDSTINYEFGLCKESNPKTYKIYICAYRINAECEKPFLQYLLERTSGTEYNFPYFKFACPDSLNTNTFSFSGMIRSVFGQPPEPEDEPIHDLSQGHTYFLNQCLMRILELIVDDQADENTDLLNDMYKGFVEQGTDSIYAFFDFTGKTLAETEEPRSWTIIDEIINNHSTLGYRINKEVEEMFLNNPKLIYVDNKDGYHIDIPSVLYLCKFVGGEYVNVFQDDPNTFSLYNERVEHPFFGDFYIFSLSPLESSKGSVSRLKRFVGFTPDPMYILKDLATITGKGPIAGEPEFMGFKLSKTLFGGPKKDEEEEQEQEEEQEEEQEDVKQEDEEQEDEEQEEGEEEEQEQEEDEEREDELNANVQLEELKNINNTSIYFKENGIPYWCIKSKLYFAEY